MPRRIVRVAAVFSLLFQWAVPWAYGDNIETLSAKVLDEISQDTEVIAVLDFTNRDGERTDIGQYLADEIANTLIGFDEGLDVVDRLALQEILQEGSFIQAMKKDPSIVKKIEESFGVQMVVLGTIAPFRDRVRVNVKMLDTSTGKMVSGFTSSIKPDEEIKELLASKRRAAERKKGSASPPPQFKNKYLKATVTSIGISPKYKTAVVSLLLENISKKDIKIALRPPTHPVYLIESSATLIDDSGVSCVGAETTGIQSEEFSFLMARSSTAVVISFNCEGVPEGEFATFSADFLSEVQKERADFSIGIPHIKIPA